MPKRKDRVASEQLFARLTQTAHGHQPTANDEDTTFLTSIAVRPIRVVRDTSKIPRLKKFRFQLLHHWLIQTVQPCAAADIGGGKGLLSYLLNQSGWSATVIDPNPQSLPEKYKDISSGLRVKIDHKAKVTYIPAEFHASHAAQFDLLIGLHAHGCNVKIIDAAAEYDCGFVLFPCCIIDEPFYPRPGVHWLESLAGYAIQKGLEIYPFRLNFKGQNIGFYHAGNTQSYSDKSG
jgi:hypothetical protein